MARGTKAAATAEHDEVYEMEDILEYRLDGGKGLWKVRWKGYGPQDDTWEPQANLLNPGTKLRNKMEDTKAQYLADKEKKEKSSGGNTGGTGRSSKRRPRKSSDVEDAEQEIQQPRENVKSARQSVSKPSSTPVVARGVCRVAHISKSDVDKKSYVCTILWNNGDSEVRPVQEVRKEFPEHLLDYLLSRIKFKDPKKNNDDE